MDFKKLGEVATVEEILDTDTVLVARDGQIYRADKSKVGGGAGGYLLELTDEDSIETGDFDGTSTLTIKTKASNIENLIQASHKGSHVAVKFPSSMMGDSPGSLITLSIASLITGEMATSLGAPAVGGASLYGEDLIVVFANSASSASVATLATFAANLRPTKPVVTEAADEVD